MDEKEVDIFSNNRKSSGTFIYTDPEYGERQFYTARCRHCGYRWRVEPGSGRNRGWCMKCNGILCGKEWCMKECIPEEAQIEIMEGNRNTIQRYINTHFVQEYLEKTKKISMDSYKNVGGILLK